MAQSLLILTKATQFILQKKPEIFLRNRNIIQFLALLRDMGMVLLIRETILLVVNQKRYGKTPLINSTT
jgi:hypothetical protein